MTGKEKCFICLGRYEHDKVTDCPAYENVKELVKARLAAMPPDVTFSIG